MIAQPQVPAGSHAPRWVQKLQYTQNTIAYLESSAQRYGEIFNAPVIGNHRTVLFISNPGAIQQIFTTDTKQLIAPPNQLLQPVVGEYSIFTLAGSRHRRERRLLMPPFHGERMRTYGQLICDLTHKAVRSRAIGSPFAARQLAQEISLAVILKVVFGIEQEDRFHQLKSLLIALTDSLKSPLAGGLLFFPSLQKDWGTHSPWGRFRSLQRQVSEVILAEIQDRRGHADGADILSLLMSAQDEAGQPMTDAELHDELVTLLLAGHETTATAIAWAMYWIHRDAQVRETLLAELHQPAVEPIAIAQLPYLSAVCNETLRIYPVAVLTVPRAVKEPVELMGHSLEPGTRLYGCIYLTHQRPDLYPDPKVFKPERFLERQFTPYEFLPFGGGARRCIGEALALFEMKLVIATLLSHYQFALADQAPEFPQRRGVIFAPARGVQIILK
jgi:cytochrome P450 family 110